MQLSTIIKWGRAHPRSTRGDRAWTAWDCLIYIRVQWMRRPFPTAPCNGTFSSIIQHSTLQTLRTWKYWDKSFESFFISPVLIMRDISSSSTFLSESKHTFYDTRLVNISSSWQIIENQISRMWRIRQTYGKVDTIFSHVFIFCTWSSL